MTKMGGPGSRLYERERHTDFGTEDTQIDTQSITKAMADPRCGAHCGLDADTVGGKCVPCELHGLCHLCVEEDWAKKFEEMRTENVHLKRTLKEASIDIPPIPDKLCAFCREVIGGDYFQGVPNIGDLCNPCHKEWKENETDNGE